METQVNDQKRFFIQTLGCKVNQYESQAMREILIRAGFKECLSKDIADIYIVNTCTVTHRADRESRYLIGLCHRTNPKAKIVVTGCYAEKNSEDIVFLPGVANILKNDDKGSIAEILAGSPVLTRAARTPLSITDFKGHSKAFLKIQDGCENFCSYCKVPLVRGTLSSRPMDDILREFKALVAAGFKEIVLTGICLGAWGKDLFPESIANDAGLDGASLADVLKALDAIPGNFRIRLSSIEPKYVTDELIALIANSKRMCRHLHIPLQSGDDEILKKMNRPYTAQGYMDLVNKVRSRIEGIAITTDILVGFPGETDAHFENTYNFVKALLPARTHIFTFSKRKDTAAYGMNEAANNEIVKKRHWKLNTAALMTSYLYRKGFLNERLDILVETKRDRQTGLLAGYSDNYIKVLFKGEDTLMKEIVPVRIEYATLAHTFGEKFLDKP